MSLRQTLYPLRFIPQAYTAAWGGTLLPELWGGEPSALTWLLVDHGTSQSVVADGELAGHTLTQLIAADPAAFVSRRHEGHWPLPLTIRLLDTAHALPLQVCPEDGEPSGQVPGPCHQAWYVLAARHNAQILAGVQTRCTHQQFVSRMATQSLAELIRHYPAEAGDSYFLPPGRIHAVGSGTLLYQVTQNRGGPLQLSDWEVVPSAAELASAIRGVHYQDRGLARIRREFAPALRNRRLPLINQCPHFCLDELRLVEAMHDKTDGSTFHFLTLLSGAVKLSWRDQHVTLSAGQHLLVPALLGAYSLEPTSSPAILLKVFLNLL